MDNRLPTSLLALVTLKASLLDKLLGFGPDVAIVPIRKLPFLCLVDGMPLGAHVDPTGQADLAARLEAARRVFAVTIDQGGERCPPIWVRRDWRRQSRHLRSDSNLVCLPRAACQGEIGLLAVLHVKL